MMYLAFPIFYFFVLLQYPLLFQFPVDKPLILTAAAASTPGNANGASPNSPTEEEDGEGALTIALGQETTAAAAEAPNGVAATNESIAAIKEEMRIGSQGND